MTEAAEPMARAVVLRGAGDVDVLDIAEVERPVAGPGQVVVEVAAAGLNRADCLQRRGLYPAPPGAPADVPGLELSGTVVECGAGVRAVSMGQRVMCLVGGGAMATHVAVHERVLVPVPDSLELEQAAAVPEVFMTAFDALFENAGLGLGETVLVHAAGSGVGTAAVQLAARAGARVVGTARTASKLERCKPLGMHEGVVVGSDKRFAGAVRAASGGRGADVVLDLVGAAYLEENLRALAPRGRIVVVGLLGGVSGTLPLGPLLALRGRIAGTTLRSRPLEEKAILAQAFAAQVLPLLADGRVAPVIDQILPMTEVREAHRLMESNQTFGKIVLRW